MRYTGNGEGHTVLILTDAESRLIRGVLEVLEKTNGRPSGANALDAFNRGIARATAKMTEEGKADWKARTNK